MNDTEKLMILADACSDALLGGECGWENMDFKEFVSECRKAIAMKNKSPFTQEERDRIDKENVILTKKVKSFERKIKYALDFITEIYAVELLEFHNKNWLLQGTNPAKLGEEKQERFREISRLLRL